MNVHGFARKTGILVLFAAITLALAPVAMAESGTDASAVASSSQQATQAQQSQPVIPRSVQERVRLRKQQRLEQQIQENYSHKYDVYLGMGYLRFHPGVNLQKINERAWVMSFSRWYTQKWGVSVEGRGEYGTAYTGPNAAVFGTFLPEIYQYTGLVGANYRFYRRPKIGATVRLAAGPSHGNFDGDAHGITSKDFNENGIGLYATSTKIVGDLSIPVDVTVTPGLAIRITPEYMLTPFAVTSAYTGNKGTQLQNNLGFNMGIVYRFGKR